MSCLQLMYLRNWVRREEPRRCISCRYGINYYCYYHYCHHHHHIRIYQKIGQKLNTIYCLFILTLYFNSVYRYVTVLYCISLAFYFNGNFNLQCSHCSSFTWFKLIKPPKHTYTILDWFIILSKVHKILGLPNAVAELRTVKTTI